MSSLATPVGGAGPSRRFASRFGRLSVLLSVGGLLLAVALSVPSSWLPFGGRGTDATGAAYADVRPGVPVRLALGGLSGVQLVAPLVRTEVEPRRLLRAPPEDAPLVSWWSGSAEAGAPRGQTVVLAHAGKDGGGLTPIGGLGTGDFVELLTRRGTMRYAVTSVRTLDRRTMARVGTTLFTQDGGAGRLVMVSAQGWDGADYDRSVVVTATPLGRPAA